jgi:hypothetical protein
MLDGAANATYTRGLEIDNQGRIVGDSCTPPTGAADELRRQRMSLGGCLRPRARGAMPWLA